MSKFYYDLHIHSCLSPCGDDDNTPNNIAGMASLCGLNIIALTDHNTCKNCPSFFEAAKKYNIVPVAGMELTTSEDIHVICLFEELDDAMAFDNYIDNHRLKIKNKPEIFGKQTVLDENDEEICEIDHLLINATDVSVEEISSLISEFNGICYPAHIDRDANGIIAALGTIPDCGFYLYEVADKSSINEYSKNYCISKERFIISSDAHYLTHIDDKENYVELNVDSFDCKHIRKKLFEYLRRFNQ